MFGSPDSILLDNGPQFRSREFRSLAEAYNVKLCYNAHYHPQANVVERVHSVLKQSIRSYLGANQRRWEDHLQKVTCALRTAEHESIKCTPFFVNFGREISFLEKPVTNVPTQVEVPTRVQER